MHKFFSQVFALACSVALTAGPTHRRHLSLHHGDVPLRDRSGVGELTGSSDLFQRTLEFSPRGQYPFLVEHVAVLVLAGTASACAHDAIGGGEQRAHALAGDKVIGRAGVIAHGNAGMAKGCQCRALGDFVGVPLYHRIDVQPRTLPGGTDLRARQQAGKRHHDNENGFRSMHGYLPKVFDESIRRGAGPAGEASLLVETRAEHISPDIESGERLD